MSRDSGVRVRRARQARRAERAGRRASSSLEDARRPALSRRRTPTDAPAGFVLPPQAPPASHPVGSRVPRDRNSGGPRPVVAIRPPGFAIASLGWALLSQTTQILRPIPIVVASPPFHYVIAIRSLRISAGRQSAIGRGRVRETCANQSKPPKPLNPLNYQTLKLSNNRSPLHP